MFLIIAHCGSCPSKHGGWGKGYKLWNMQSVRMRRAQSYRSQWQTLSTACQLPLAYLVPPAAPRASKPLLKARAGSWRTQRRRGLVRSNRANSRGSFVQKAYPLHHVRHVLCAPERHGCPWSEPDLPETPLDSFRKGFLALSGAQLHRDRDLRRALAAHAAAQRPGAAHVHHGAEAHTEASRAHSQRCKEDGAALRRGSGHARSRVVARPLLHRCSWNGPRGRRQQPACRP